MNWRVGLLVRKLCVLRVVSSASLFGAYGVLVGISNVILEGYQMALWGRGYEMAFWTGYRIVFWEGGMKWLSGRGIE